MGNLTDNQYDYQSQGYNQQTVHGQNQNMHQQQYQINRSQQSIQVSQRSQDSFNQQYQNYGNTSNLVSQQRVEQEYKLQPFQNQQREPHFLDFCCCFSFENQFQENEIAYDSNLNNQMNNQPQSSQLYIIQESQENKQIKNQSNQSTLNQPQFQLKKFELEQEKVISKQNPIQKTFNSQLENQEKQIQYNNQISQESNQDIQDNQDDQSNKDIKPSETQDQLLNFLFSGQIEKVMEFINDNQFDINADIQIKPLGTKLLHIACHRGFTSFVQFLLSKGAVVDAQDDQGQTALMFATMENQLDSLFLLLQQGANLQIKNNKNQTAINIAEQKKLPHIVILLNKYVKKQSIYQQDSIQLNQNSFLFLNDNKQIVKQNNKSIQKQMQSCYQFYIFYINQSKRFRILIIQIDKLYTIFISITYLELIKLSPKIRLSKISKIIIRVIIFFLLKKKFKFNLFSKKRFRLTVKQKDENVLFN